MKKKLKKLILKNYGEYESPKLFEFPQEEKPKISLIIPVYNKYQMTKNCLWSILQHTKRISYEVIVADDCSTDETQNILDEIKGIQYVRTEQNSGFGANVENAVSHAKGEYICLLNNDMLFFDNWLNAIVDILDHDSTIGIAGGTLLAPDGTVSELGCVVSSQNKISRIGHGCTYSMTLQTLNDFDFDYKSGCLLVMKRSLWEKLDGFDKALRPAYYEDVDLCFRVRSLGLKVVNILESRAIHFETISYGDKGTDRSEIAQRNGKYFYQKWGEVLSDEKHQKSIDHLLAQEANYIRHNERHPFYHKEKLPDGKRHIYIFGIKLLTYKKRKSAGKIPLDEILSIQKSYLKLQNQIQKKVHENKPIKVGFLVTQPSMFSARAIMEKMCQDKDFQVTILIVPDFRFGVERAKNTMQQCIDELADFKEYLYIAPFKASEDKIKLSDLVDILFFQFYYDVSHPKYALKNVVKSGVLPVLSHYTMENNIFTRKTIIPSWQYALFWKIFIDENYSLQEYKQFAILKDKNVVLSGCYKMDAYKDIPHSTTKKTIIIAPHHSIKGGYNDLLCLSNFLKYAPLFLNLPDMYPNIHFIFRPHPALLPLLEQDAFWGKEKTNQYMRDMASKKNVTISLGGDYLKEFAQSDGIIQDCASFLTEYFWTKKPQCYLLKTPEDIEKKFVPLGQACLRHCYIGYETSDILSFIDNVILKGDDPKKKEREDFFTKELMMNYPNVSQTIVNYIRDQFK